MSDGPTARRGLDRRSALATVAGGLLATDTPVLGDVGAGPASIAPTRSLLDFMPHGRIAPMIEGHSTWDASEAINRGIRDMGPGALLSPSGVTYTLGQPIDLQRGTALRHLGSFDDTPGRGAIIKLLPGADCAAIRTPAARGGEPTHFTCLEGFCIDGSSATQTRATRAGAVQWWGEFIGSEIRRVMVKDTLGPGLTLGRGADVLLEHVWVVGTCLPDGGYAFDTNIDVTGEVRGGLVTMTHIFVENPSVTRAGEPRHREDDRGNAVRFHRLASAHVGRMHIEGARRSLSVESCDQIDIGLLSGTWLGHSADPDRCFVDLVDAHTRALRINSISCFTGQLPLVRKRHGVTSDSLPDLEAAGYGLNLGYAASNDRANGAAVAPATRFANAVAVATIGKTDRAVINLVNAASGSSGHIALTGARLELGVSRDGVAPGSDAPHIALAAPVLVGHADGEAPAEALVRRNGSIAVGRAGRLPDILVTLRIIDHAPRSAPDAIGVLLYCTADRRLWLSVGTASMADWTPFG